VRPLKAGMDQSATMQPLESGHYKGTLLLPTGGLWDATASVTSNGNNFQILKRFVLP